MNKIITMKKTILGFISAGVLILTSCSSKENKDASKQNADSVIMVTVANTSANDAQDLSLSGQIEASQTVNVSTRLMGYITFLKVKVGDHVNKGQLLATISNQDIMAKRAQADAMIAEAEAALKNAKKDQERFNNLYAQQSASAKELDNINLQYNSAKARVDAARQMRNEVNAMLDYANLTAPFSGIVTQKFAEAGSMANPGMPILTIEQNGVFQVSAAVPENSIQQVQQGATATIGIKALDRTFKGTVTQINQSSQFTGGQYLIKVSIPANEQKGLYAGMYTNIAIPVKKEAIAKTSDNSILVPASVIEYKNQLSGLYTISSNNTALLRWVRLGKTYGDKIEVLSGLEKNESFILSADKKLFNGAAVKIK